MPETRESLNFSAMTGESGGRKKKKKKAASEKQKPAMISGVEMTEKDAGGISTSREAHTHAHARTMVI